MTINYYGKNSPLVGRVIYSVATGMVDPFKSVSRKAARYISGLNGFVAVHVDPSGMGTLWFFDSLNHAKVARNMMEAEGIQCGKNICKFKVDNDGVPQFAGDGNA